MRIRFDARPRHRLRLEDGSYLQGGREADVADAFGLELVTNPHIPCSEVEPPSDLLALHRPDLDALAAEAGVEGPDKLPNKQAVVDAIAALPEADGEGHTTDPDGKD